MYKNVFFIAVVAKFCDCFHGLVNISLRTESADFLQKKVLFSFLPKFPVLYGHIQDCVSMWNAGYRVLCRVRFSIVWNTDHA